MYGVEDIHAIPDQLPGKAQKKAKVSAGMNGRHPLEAEVAPPDESVILQKVDCILVVSVQSCKPLDEVLTEHPVS
jgi:hypothetical protein